MSKEILDDVHDIEELLEMMTVEERELFHQAIKDNSIVDHMRSNLKPWVRIISMNALHLLIFLNNVMMIRSLFFSLRRSRTSDTIIFGKLCKLSFLSTGSLYFS